MASTNDSIPARPRTSDPGPRPSDRAQTQTDLGPRTSDLGLFLHASSVVVEGGALLFLGHSTAGKSTIARLLGEAHPVLADDAVFVSRRPEGRWWVVDGGFRFGEGDFADWQTRIRRQIDEKSVPLRGCLRIHQATENRIAPMEPVELARHLTDAAMEIDLQRKFGRIGGLSKAESVAWDEVLRMRRHWFGLAAEIARTEWGAHFWFSKASHWPELSAILKKLPKNTEKPKKQSI